MQDIDLDGDDDPDDRLRAKTEARTELIDIVEAAPLDTMAEMDQTATVLSALLDQSEEVDLVAQGSSLRTITNMVGAFNHTMGMASLNARIDIAAGECAWLQYSPSC